MVPAQHSGVSVGASITDSGEMKRGAQQSHMSEALKGGAGSSECFLCLSDATSLAHLRTSLGFPHT